MPMATFEGTEPSLLGGPAVSFANFYGHDITLNP